MSSPARAGHPPYAHFLMGGLAACCSVTITNPVEVIKTRLQLQGELMRKDAKAPVVYRGVAHAFVKIAKTEGLAGL